MFILWHLLCVVQLELQRERVLSTTAHSRRLLPPTVVLLIRCRSLSVVVDTVLICTVHLIWMIVVIRNDCSDLSCFYLLSCFLACCNYHDFIIIAPVLRDLLELRLEICSIKGSYNSFSVFLNSVSVIFQLKDCFLCIEAVSSNFF